jgi:putative tricarboxylic transport membrane protein
VRRADIYSGGLLVVFGLVMIFAIVPSQIDSTGDYGLDPKFFPVSLLWIIVYMSALLVGSRWMIKVDDRDDPGPLDRQNWMFIGGSALYLLVGFVTIDFAGFIPGGILMIAVLMYLMGERQNWIRLASVSVATPIVIYLAMRHLFTIQLP